MNKGFLETRFFHNGWKVLSLHQLQDKSIDPKQEWDCDKSNNHKRVWDHSNSLSKYPVVGTRCDD